MFKPGDNVILYDKKERVYLINLEQESNFESHLGNIAHNDIIGIEEGNWVQTNNGHWLLVFKPTRNEFVVNMDRIATVIYPKDSAAIINKANLNMGSKVIEAGSGSGSLTIAISEAIGPKGHLFSYDLREDMSSKAKQNFNKLLPNSDNVTFKIGDVNLKIDEKEADAIIFDLPEPWNAVDQALVSLRHGGVIIAFLPTIMQVSNYVDSLKKTLQFSLIETTELLERPWTIGGRSIRPDHMMTGHTGFITFARKCFIRPDKESTE